ncbi:hypothetical protein QE152_g12713 [Popillia japonica]|uniref:C2H2-type domain-containing protein n=1 Tax=Popillia japonica TaxID=7064 RepID=A0AAW1LQT4_POPJA
MPCDTTILTPTAAGAYVISDINGSAEAPPKTNDGKTPKRRIARLKPDKSKVRYKKQRRRCSLCMKFLPLEDLDDHVKNHSLTCDRCGKECFHHNQYRLHLKLHMQMDKKGSSRHCRQCGKRFESQRKLQEHFCMADVEVICNDINFDESSDIECGTTDNLTNPSNISAKRLLSKDSTNSEEAETSEAVIEIVDSDDGETTKRCVKCNRMMERTDLVKGQRTLCHSCLNSSSNSLSNSDDCEDALVIDENF